MPTLIARPTRVETAGNKPIVIDEYVGLINTSEAECADYLAVCLPAYSLEMARRDT